MATYNVRIKNINADVSKMKIPVGETRTVRINSKSLCGINTAAVKKMFNNCRFMNEGIQNTGGGDYGQVTYPGAGGTQLYGRIYVEVLDDLPA
jgi:hypothetical protein